MIIQHARFAVFAKCAGFVAYDYDLFSRAADVFHSEAVHNRVHN